MSMLVTVKRGLKGAMQHMAVTAAVIEDDSRYIRAL